MSIVRSLIKYLQYDKNNRYYEYHESTDEKDRN